MPQVQASGPAEWWGVVGSPEGRRWGKIRLRLLGRERGRELDIRLPQSFLWLAGSSESRVWFCW